MRKQVSVQNIVAFRGVWISLHLSMAVEFSMLDGLKVIVDQVIYVPNVSNPPLQPYGFVYFISIENQSAEAVQILARKWIVKEHSGETTVVEGEGVVGEKPIIEPGDTFSYNSCHVIGSDAVAKGSFFGQVVRTKRPIMVEIPEFELVTP